VLSGAAELDLSGGHDDNLMLSVAPDAPESLRRLGGPYLAVSPLLAGACAGRGSGLRLALMGDYRGTDDVGRVDTHSAELRGWLPRWGPLRLFLAGTGGAFLASRFPEDEYFFLGGELGLALAFADELTLMAEGRVDRRMMRAAPTPADATQAAADPARDWLLAPSVRLRWQPTSYLELGPSAALLEVRDSLGGGRTFRRWHAGLGATGLRRALTMAAEVGAGRLSFAETAETHLGGRASLRLDLSPTVGLHAAAELSEPISSGATRDYARRLFTLGIVLQTSHERRPPAAPVPELRPRVQGAEVRFRYRAPEATRVTVVGSWNDWAAPGAALEAPTQGDLWELSTRLPPGTHRYHFLVDGKAQRPPEAGRYVADDFGSEDGVVEVGPAPERGASAPPLERPAP
jgi:hypothetical protein